MIPHNIASSINAKHSSLELNSNTLLGNTVLALRQGLAVNPESMGVDTLAPIRIRYNKESIMSVLSTPLAIRLTFEIPLELVFVEVRRVLGVVVQDVEVPLVAELVHGTLCSILVCPVVSIQEGCDHIQLIFPIVVLLSKALAMPAIARLAITVSAFLEAAQPTFGCGSGSKRGEDGGDLDRLHFDRLFDIWR